MRLRRGSGRAPGLQPAEIHQAVFQERAAAMSERIIVVGAGIAGLSTALALQDSGHQVTLLDRDPPPPAGSPDEAFEDWDHGGVPQLRHSHVFLARLYNLLRDRYPEVRRRLLEAGARELTFEGGLPATLRAQYVPEPVDADFTILSSRRTTLELVLRRYVEECTSVELKPATRVESLLTEAGTPLRVTGVRAIGPEGEAIDMPADLVVDAGGRRTTFPRELRALGVRIEEEEEDCGILYYTRHYRLRPGMTEPPPGIHPGGGDLGYVKYGIFPADNGWYSITLATPTPEAEMRRALVEADAFQHMCMRMPAVAAWVDPERAEPVSRVFGMGGLQNRYRHFVFDGKPSVLGFLPVGDACLHGNPLYGRGCSQGALHAHVLADAVREHTDPAARAVAFAEATKRELRPFYEAGRSQDRTNLARALRSYNGDTSPRPLKSRIAKSFIEDAVVPATRGDLYVLRQLSLGFHMLESPSLAFKRPKVMARILWYWLRGKKRNAPLAIPPLGPKRAEIFAELGIEPAT